MRKDITNTELEFYMLQYKEFKFQFLESIFNDKYLEQVDYRKELIRKMLMYKRLYNDTRL